MCPLLFGVTIKVTFNWPAQQVGARCAYLLAYNATLKKLRFFIFTLDFCCHQK